MREHVEEKTGCEVIGDLERQVANWRELSGRQAGGEGRLRELQKGWLDDADTHVWWGDPGSWRC